MAGSRHRIDLSVYAVHYEDDRLHEALVAAWGQIQATQLAIDLATPERDGDAVKDPRSRFAGRQRPDRQLEHPRLGDRRQALGIGL